MSFEPMGLPGDGSDGRLPPVSLDLDQIDRGPFLGACLFVCFFGGGGGTLLNWFERGTKQTSTILRIPQS